MSVLTRDGSANLTRETKLSGANGDRENSTFPVQLTTSRIIGNHTRLMPSLRKMITTRTQHTHKHTHILSTGSFGTSMSTHHILELKRVPRVRLFADESGT